MPIYLLQPAIFGNILLKGYVFNRPKLSADLHAKGYGEEINITT